MLIKQWINGCLLLLLALVLTGCGGSISGGTAEQNGDLVIGLTDADGDFLSYAVDVTSISLERANGTYVEALPVTTRIDFAQYVDLTELLTAATVPSGAYVAASLTLDYSNADIQVEQGGVAVKANVQDSNGDPVTTLTVKVTLEGQHHLTIAPGVPNYLTLDFDLAGSNTVDTTVTPPQVTVEPVLLADVELNNAKQHRLRGLLSEVDVVNSRIELTMRPFALQRGRFGSLNAYVDNSTSYEINGVSYSGSTGLNQMDQLALNSWVIVYGALDMTTHRFQASEVYAGSSVPGSSLDSVTGVVLSRSGNQLVVDAGSVVTRDGSLIFNQQVTVTLDAGTKVTRQQSQATFTSDDISVGQRLLLLGDLSSDHTGMTNTIVARLLLSQISGTVVSNSGGNELVLDLQRIDGRTVSRFDFSGTGSVAANNADPTNYQVDVAGLNVTSLAVGDPARVKGYVAPFGQAPADFNATTVIGVANVTAALRVVWPGGDTSPFSSQAADGLVLDLTGSSVHHVTRDWVVTNLNSLASATTIKPRTSDIGLFAIRARGSVHVYARFSNFEADLSDRLSGGLPVKHITAHGQFDADTATLTATSMTVVFGSLVGG
jgi:hypothetical protein